MSSISNAAEFQNAVDYNRIPLEKKTKWHEKETAVRIQAAAFMALGLIAAAASATLLVAGFAFGAVPAVVAIGAGSACAIGAIGFLIRGVILKNRPCWNDQSYVDKVAKKIEAMPYSQITAKHGVEHLKAGYLISKQFLTAKFLEEIKSSKLDYLTVVIKYGNDLKKLNLIDIKELYPLIKSEVESCSMTLQAFKAKYGDQPLIDGVIPKNDPWYLEACNHGIKDKSYASIKEIFKHEISTGQITKEMIQVEIQKQYESVRPNVQAFVKQQGGADSFWKLIRELIVEKSIVKKDFIDQELHKQASTLINTYGWNVLENGFIDLDTLRSKVLREIEDKQMHFDDIIRNFGWKVFETNTVKGTDSTIRKTFVSHSKSMPFCELFDNYGVKINNYNLLNPETKQLVKTLGEQKKSAEEAYSKAISKNKSDYMKEEVNAELSLKEYKSKLQLNVDKAELAITKANNSLKDAIEREQQAANRLVTELAKQSALLHAENLNSATSVPPVVDGRVVPGSRTNQDQILIQRKLVELENKISLNKKRIQVLIDNHNQNLIHLNNDLRIAKNMVDDKTAIEKWHQANLAKPKEDREKADKEARESLDKTKEYLNFWFNLNMNSSTRPVD